MREGGTGWQDMAPILQRTKRGRHDEHTEGRRGQDGQRDREGRSLVGPYPSHCSHVRLHLIGWFVVSLQEEDGRLDRPVRGYDLCEE